MPGEDGEADNYVDGFRGLKMLIRQVCGPLNAGVRATVRSYLLRWSAAQAVEELDPGCRMEKVIRALSSYKASILLLLIFAGGLATATLVEKNMGTVAAKMLIYYSPLFLFLQLMLVVNFLLLLNRYHYIRKKKWTLMVIHASLIIILGGALTTHLFGREGQVHIREGESSDEMVMHTSRGTRVEKLPFQLELTDFRLHRYPGSESPSSYESSLRIHIDGEVREAEVFMNNVLDLKGYRFFQASYDPDEQGTILSVNRDPIDEPLPIAVTCCYW